ncbi:MAG: sensor histidine kinase [Schleiferiaceae bacterium]
MKKWFLYVLIVCGAFANAQSPTFDVYQDSIDHWVDARNYERALRYINKQHPKKKVVSDWLATQKARIFVKSKIKMDSIPTICQKIIGENISEKDSINIYILAKNYEILGHYYYRIRERQQAIQQLKFSALLFDNIDSYESSLYCSNMVGTIYYLDKNYKPALETFYKCLDYFDMHPEMDTNAYIDLKIDVGLVFQALEQYEKSNREYKEALDLIEGESPLQKGNLYNNLGLNYTNLGKKDLALYYLNKSSVEYKKIDHPYISRVYNNIGILHHDYFNDPKTAIEYYNKSLELKGDQPSISIADTKLNIGAALISSDQPNLALKNIKEALAIYREFEFIEGILNSYDLLVSNYQEIGDYKSAFEAQKTITELTDSLTKFQTNLEINSIITSYELKNSEFLREKEEVENEILESYTAQSRVISFSIIGFLIGLSVLFFFLYRNSNQKQKTSLQLAKKDKELSVISSLVKGQENERNRIARELHDSLGNTLAILKNKAQLLRAQDPEILNLVKLAAEEVRTISHDLMPESLLRFGLYDALEDLKKLWELNENIIIDLNVPAEINDHFSDEQTQTIYRILQETIKNAVQHGKATFMVIQFNFEDGDSLNIMIEDNGIGFDPKKRKDGIGLKNIENRVHFLRGFINIESSNNGTQIKISIPVDYAKT